MQISHLSVLMAAQLGLAGFLWYSNNQQTEPQPLLAAAEFSELTLVKGPGKSEAGAKTADQPAAAATRITLQQQDGRWQFNAGSAQQQLWLAADPVKMQQLLTDLHQARLNWPLADSSESQGRFAVSAEEYQWQLQLKATDTGAVQTLWLGDSAGFRQQYLRRDGENAIYQVALNSYELSVDPEQWLDKNQLAFKDIQAVRGPDFSLIKSPPKPDGNSSSAENQEWQLTGLAPVANSDVPALNQSSADQLLEQLQRLTVRQYLPKAPEGAEQAFKQAFRLTVTAANREGNTADLTLSLVETDGQYLIRRSDLDAIFSVDQSLYNNVVSTNLAKLRQPSGQQVATTEQSPSQQMINSLSQQLKPGQTAPTPTSTAPQQKREEVEAAGAAGSAKPD